MTRYHNIGNMLAKQKYGFKEYGFESSVIHSTLLDILCYTSIAAPPHVWPWKHAIIHVVPCLRVFEGVALRK